MRPGRRSLAGRRSSLSNRIQEQNPGRLCDRNDAAVTNYSGRHDLASLRSARGSVAGRTSFGRQRAFCVRSSSSIGKQESALESHLGETHVQVHLPSSSQASRSDSNQGRSARFSPAEVVRLQILEGQGKTPTMFARHSNTHHHSGHSVRGPSTSNVMGNVEGPMTEASSQEWQGAPFSLDVPGHISTTQGVVVPRPSLSELINEHLDDSQNRSTATVPSPTNDLPNGSQTRSDLIDAGTSMSRTTRKSHLTSDAVPEHEPTSYAHEEIQENRNKTSAGENGSHQLSEQRSSTPNIGYETNTGRQPADINHGSVGMEAVKINLYSKERMKKIDENLLQMVDPNSEKPGVGGWRESLQSIIKTVKILEAFSSLQRRDKRKKQNKLKRTFGPFSPTDFGIPYLQ